MDKIFFQDFILKTIISIITKITIIDVDGLLLLLLFYNLFWIYHIM